MSMTSEATKVFFPVVLEAVVGGFMLPTLSGGRLDTKTGAMVGAGLGVIWGIMQAEKRSEPLSEAGVIVEEELGDLGAAEVSATDMTLSRNVVLGAIALFAAYNIYGRMSGQNLAQAY